MTTPRLYGIRQMATEFDVTLRTLRFYEGRGLLTPSRANNGDRVYSENDRERLTQILAWTRYGFTLSEIKAALASGGFSQDKLREQIEQLSRQRDEMWDAISELEEQVAA